MMGRRKIQGMLFDVGNVFPFALDPTSFHGQLASAARRLFSDEVFAKRYHPQRGRYSVPPSNLALLLLLQAEAGYSDAAALDASAYDVRWCAVLGKALGEPLCARSTLQLFRADLVLHPESEVVLKASLEEAKRAGLLKGHALRIAIDTKPIIGRGAVLDTYNLLGGGIAKLARALAAGEGCAVEEWAQEHDLRRYFGGRESSLKGSADLDWSDAKARNEFLHEIVTDGRRLMRMAEAFLRELPEAHTEAECDRERRVREPYELLQQLLVQDVRESTDADGKPQVEIKEGTASERIPSLTDPEERHGRKSKSKKFTGHKLRIAVEVETELIAAVEVLAGSAGDAENTLAAVEQAEANTGLPVAETLGDCAYGGGETRQAFEGAHRTLHAKVPQPATNGEFFPKDAFQIDLAEGSVTCPGGHTTTVYHTTSKGAKVFEFGEYCAGCPLRPQCTKSEHGRTLQVHAQEKLLAAARAFQQTPEGREKLRDRTGVEHALARMAQRGVGQARYFGRQKTRFQMMMAATVVNLRKIWNGVATGPPGEAASGAKPKTPTDPRTGGRAHVPGGAENTSEGTERGESTLNRPVIWGFRAFGGTTALRRVIFAY